MGNCCVSDPVDAPRGSADTQRHKSRECPEHDAVGPADAAALTSTPPIDAVHPSHAAEDVVLESSPHRSCVPDAATPPPQDAPTSTPPNDYLDPMEQPAAPGALALFVTGTTTTTATVVSPSSEHLRPQSPTLTSPETSKHSKDSKESRDVTPPSARNPLAPPSPSAPFDDVPCPETAQHDEMREAEHTPSHSVPGSLSQQASLAASGTRTASIELHSGHAPGSFASPQLSGTYPSGSQKGDESPLQPTAVARVPSMQDLHAPNLAGINAPPDAHDAHASSHGTQQKSYPLQQSHTLDTTVDTRSCTHVTDDAIPATDDFAQSPPPPPHPRGATTAGSEAATLDAPVLHVEPPLRLPQVPDHPALAGAAVDGPVDGTAAYVADAVGPLPFVAVDLNGDGDPMLLEPVATLLDTLDSIDPDYDVRLREYIGLIVPYSAAELAQRHRRWLDATIEHLPPPVDEDVAALGLH